MAPLLKAGLLAATFTLIGHASVADPENGFFGRERPVTENNCIPGPHDPTRVRRTPGRSRYSSKPNNPLAETFVHCRAKDDG